MNLIRVGKKVINLDHVTYWQVGETIVEAATSTPGVYILTFRGDHANALRAWLDEHATDVVAWHEEYWRSERMHDLANEADSLYSTLQEMLRGDIAHNYDHERLESVARQAFMRSERRWDKLMQV